MFAAFAINSTSVHSQIIPDTTLGSQEGSIVTPNVINNLPANQIDGGAIRGANLFHSLREFNIGEAQRVYFANPTGIENILSRVTGSNPSTILGTLGVLGNANLFLINPNGIIFGPNARLNLGGSFLATTADSINLSDGSRFDTKNPQPIPLLTVSVPSGLNFNTGNPGSIKVEGYGHNLFTIASVGAPVFGSGQSLTGLRTQPGKTIALVGGRVNFDGGILTAPSGRIEVGSVATGSVDVSSTANGLFLSYDNVPNYQDIQLDKVSLLDASGFFNGDIFLQGNNVTLTDASLAVISNFGSFPLGKVVINATDKLKVDGIQELTRSINNTVTLARGIVTQSFSTGKGADIVASVGQLYVQDFGGIATQTFGFGSGGDITLKVKDETGIFSNPLPFTGLTVSTIATFTSGEGDGGNLELSTKKVSIENGGIFAAETFNSGDGGDVTINASESIKISGGVRLTFDNNFVNNSFWPSFSGALTTASGNAGDVSIKTRQLMLENGARLDATTLASGSAGKLSIIATDSVEVIGKAPGFLTPTQIISSANVADPFFNLIFNLSKPLDGNSGSIIIDTNRLIVRDGAQISVKNDGLTNGGTLEINANSINLDNQAAINASTRNGTGGNITIKSDDWLLMRRNSQISTNAGNAQAGGDGGQIDIDTKFLIAPPLENSDITANAFEGKGGNVRISATAIFGFVPRSREQLQTLLRTDNPNELDPSRLPSSDITAISQTNPSLSGDLTIITPNIDPNNGLVDLPVEITDLSNSIGQECANTVGPEANKFIITGRGGLPEDPTKPLNGQTIWTDSRLFLTTEKPTSPPAPTTQPTDSTAIPLTEASLVEINSEGEAVLTAAPSSSLQVPWVTPSCHAS